MLSRKIVSFFVKENLSSREKLWRHRLIIMVSTFLIYIVYHVLRKVPSVVKGKWFNGNQTDPQNWLPFNNNSLLSVFDVSYSGVYAISIFFMGFAAERSNLRQFLTISLILCGMISIVFGLAYSFQIHSIAFFIIAQVLNGIFHATAWPTILAIVGGWFGSTKKGFLFGLWNLHTNIGNIIGLALAGTFVDYSWGLSYIVPGLISILMAAYAWLLIVPTPGDVDLQVEMALPSLKQTNNNHLKKKKAISVWRALKIPGVIEFSMSLFFVKSVSLMFLHWLPKYIEESGNLSASKSAYASIMFDIGGSFGSIAAGLMADFTNASGSTCVTFLSLNIPMLYLFQKFSNLNMKLNMTLQFFTGFLVNGPYALITTAVAANLACKVPSKSAMATVSALVDGMGSIGAALGPAITGPVSDHFGWESVFYLAMIADIIALLCLLRIVFEELNNCKKREKA